MIDNGYIDDESSGGESAPRRHQRLTEMFDGIQRCIYGPPHSATDHQAAEQGESPDSATDQEAAEPGAPSGSAISMTMGTIRSGGSNRL